MGKNLRWTKEELDILKDKYGKIDIEEIMKLLPQRTKNAIKTKAKDLKLTKNTRGELKEITMIFNGRPSENAIRNFVKIINEIKEENELKKLLEENVTDDKRKSR